METRIVIYRMEIRNFKGLEHLDLEFPPAGGRITGDNGVGKTSVYDAFVWLLYGKDSLGRERFDIKPLSATGTLARRREMTSVEAILMVNRRRVRLRRTYYEKWVKRRGEEVFEGNASDYWVDGVALTRSGYDREVDALLGEERFRLLTDAHYFSSQMGWRERREVLFRMAQIQSDRELVEGQEKFRELWEALDKLDLEDYRKKLEARRRSLVQQGSGIPARISENRARLVELEQVEQPGLEEKREQLRRERERLSVQLLEEGGKAQEERLRQELRTLDAQLRALDAENLAYRRQQQRGASLAELEAQAAARNQAVEDTRQRRAALEKKLGKVEQLLQDADAMARELQRSRRDPEICPQCGRRLSGAALERVREGLSQKWQEDQELAEREAKRSREEMLKILKALEQAKAEEQLRQEELAQARVAVEKRREEPILDLPEYAGQRKNLIEQLKKARELLEEQQRDSLAATRALRQEQAQIQAELDGVEQALACRDLAKRCRERIEELNRQAGETETAIAQVDRKMALCREFLSYKASQVEERVNALFTLTRFRLYRPLVGGGLEDCCDPTYRGIPYESLNSGAKINVGLDIIAALSRAYGMWAPLFVDNAESVNRLTQVETQVIRLEVGVGPLRLEAM